MKVKIITSIVLAALFASSAYAEVQSESINTKEGTFTIVEDTRVSNQMEPVPGLQAKLETNDNGTIVANGKINSGLAGNGKVALQWDSSTGTVSPSGSDITYKTITSDVGIPSTFRIVGGPGGMIIPNDWFKDAWITRPTVNGAADYFVSTVHQQNYSGVYVLSTIATTWTD